MPVNPTLMIIAVLCCTLPFVIISVMFWMFIQQKKSTKVFLRLNDMEFAIKPVKAHGKKLYMQFEGKSKLWNIKTKPKIFDTFWGKVPMWKVSFGNPDTEDFNDLKVEKTTEDEQALLEEQGTLRALLTTANLDVMNILLIIVAAIAAGAVGFIAGGKYGCPKTP